MYFRAGIHVKAKASQQKEIVSLMKKIQLKLRKFDPETRKLKEPSLWDKLSLLWWRVWHPLEYDELLEIITREIELEQGRARVREWKAGDSQPNENSTNKDPKS